MGPISVANDFNEPYSSVSFQYKQLTSPHPSYTPHHHADETKIMKAQFKRWLRHNQQKILLFFCLLLFILYCLSDYISFYWHFIKIKMDNTMFDKGYVSCGILRKEPALFVEDTHHVQVIWELNCGTSTKKMMLLWEQEDGAHAIEVEPNTLDPYHTVYRSTIGPIKKSGPVKYTIQVDDGSRIRTLSQHAFEWHVTTEYEPIRIAAMADNQFGMTTFSAILQRIHKLAKTPSTRPHYLIHAGDAVQNYPSLRQWQTDFAAPLTTYQLAQSMPMIYAHGNHDYDALNEYIYTRARTDSPWFALSMANGAIRFIVLDSNLDWELQDQWLKEELTSEACQQAHFRIVIVHIPPFLEYWEPDAWFNKGQHEWGAFVKNRYVPLFEQYGVDVVISGHQHNYERGERNGIHYAIIGGAGGDVDYEKVVDWGMYEATLLDFHFVMLEFTPKGSHWTLSWETRDKSGKKVDSTLIESRSHGQKQE
jgi:predicted phosphodiesterase